MRNVIALCTAVVLAAACGGNSKSSDGNPECTLLGMACTDSAACCSGNCDPTAGVCSRVPGTCGADGDACQSGPDCCSVRCEDNECSGDQCVSDGESCNGDGECCSGLCSGGTCTPLNPNCRTSGNSCTTDGECCSKFCKDGLCNNAPSFCTQLGDTCTDNLECCGGYCVVPAGGTLGTCEQAPSEGATGCANMGEVCGAGASHNPGDPLPQCGGECCSRACFPYGPTGVLVCQPPSGCRPTGELCTKDSDCCGSAGSPDGDLADVKCRKEEGLPVGRCDNGNVCAAAGMICRLDEIQCNATANCCGGNVHQVDICHQDSLGIPRCGVAPGMDCTTPPVGQPCASSADCCGLPCVPVPGSEFEQVCGESCVPTDGTCTTSADCCFGGTCNIEPGAASGTCGMGGTCAEYGQQCSDTMPCCNAVPCTNGYCTNDVIL